MRAKVTPKPFGKPAVSTPRPTGPRVAIRPLFLYGGFALLLGTNALTLVGMLRDTTYAQAVQLLAEYAPQPPYQAGTPGSAPRRVKTMVEEMFVAFTPQARAALAQAAGRRR